jgi:hypothetical protein
MARVFDRWQFSPPSTSDLDQGQGQIFKPDLLANLGNAGACWLYIDDKALAIRRANDPPIRKSRIRKGDRKGSYQQQPA